MEVMGRHGSEIGTLEEDDYKENGEEIRELLQLVRD